MIHNPRNQTGSAHVLITITLIVAIFGLLGFVVWQNFINKPADSKQASTSEQSKVTQESKAKSNEGYIVIEEWGVKFLITDSLKSTEVQYNQRKSNNQPPQTSYAFTTARIRALGSACGKQPFGDTVILSRYSERPVVVPDGELVNEVAIDGYYYTIGQPPAGCSSFDESGEMKDQSQVEIDDRNALKESIRKLVTEE